MKNKYTRLKLKMLLWVFLGAVAAVGLCVVLLEVLFGGTLGGAVEWLYSHVSQTIFGRTEMEALAHFQRNILGHREELMLVGVVVLMLVAFYCAMGRFTRWLDQIGASVRQMVAGEEETLSLPRELSPVQTDLSALQDRLAFQKKEQQEFAQRKSDMVAFLAHDLKTPLTSVVGYLSLLEEKPDLTPAQREQYTHVALEKSRRLQELLGEFFDISRMDLQAEETEKTPIQLSILLEQLADEFFPQFSEKELTCQTKIASGLTVRGDPDRLARVFDNVLRNAVSYSEPGGTIQLTATQNGKNVEVAIANQGMEIPEQELTHIFEKFYRLDAARSTRTGGAGLGLAIAKEITESHGGTIRAECNGKRAVFYITLPLWEA
ncbi:MAG: HAMP domain-containing sensor histidine kinase [Oscillospiraceae bacterium]